jgi:hypothetical protein
MTVVDVPETPVVDGAQLLFEEARQRRRHRRLVSGMALLAFLVVLGVMIGLLAARRGGGSVEPVAAPIAASGTVHSATAFSVRPVLCYAVPFASARGQTAATGPLPVCGAPYQLTASNLGVTPDSGNLNGYTSRTDIPADPQFAAYPSTAGRSIGTNATVLLPGLPAQGNGRDVLGPAGLTGSAVRSAAAVDTDGQWTIDLDLTAPGSVRWDALAHQQFHALVGVVDDGTVVSAPITQPTQSSFTSFDGRVQISGSFTEQQAKALAARL